MMGLEPEEINGQGNVSAEVVLEKLERTLKNLNATLFMETSVSNPEQMKATPTTKKPSTRSKTTKAPSKTKKPSSSVLGKVTTPSSAAGATIDYDVG